jgi:hypothetical protein
LENRLVFSRLTFACALVLGSSALLPAAAPPPAPAPVPRRDPVVELVDKMNARIDNPIQPNGMTVKEYLEKLAKAQGVEIEIDEASFKADGIPVPGEEKLSFRAPKGVRLHTLLSMVCCAIDDRDRAENDRRGVLTRDGRIIITTRFTVHTEQRQRIEVDGTRDWTLLTTVWVSAADEPLSGVLRRFADVYDVNVVITSRAAKLAETRITTRVLNAPLGPAVQSLADQCGLDVFVRNNVILVTVAEHAKALKQEQDWLEARREVQSKTWAAERAALEPLGNAAGVLNLRVKLIDPTVDEKTTVDARNTPFRQIISNLAVAGFNVVIDPTVGKKADTEVTAKLSGVSCEASVKMLAELAGLRAVRMDNSIFVTTPEKADRLAPSQAAKPKKKEKKNP